MSQEIIFTTLPHKRISIDGNDFLQLSVYTSIKLNTPSDTNLGNFKNILNWSEKIKNADFKFKLSNGKIVEAQLDKSQLDVDLYQNIFHKNIKVDDFKEENFSKKKFLSVPVIHIQNFIFNNLKKAAIEEPKNLVSADKFIDVNRFAAISRFKLKDKKIANNEQKYETKLKVKPLYAKDIIKKDDGTKNFKKNLQKNNFVPFTKKIRPRTDFIQLREFHRVDRKFAKNPTFKIQKPVFEFHNIMAVINSYPQIMRKMGFILDFLIPYEASIPSKGHIKIVPEVLDLDEQNSVLSIPATAYEITETGFYVADKDDSIFKQGFVKINSDQFSVVQIDADGAALKTSNMVDTKVNQIAKFYETRSKIAVSKQEKTKIKEIVAPPEEEGLPYMRTAGIAITKNGMAEHLYASIHLNETLKKTFKQATPKTIAVKKNLIIGQTPKPLQLQIKEPEVVLYSNEIVQGYRMDIAYKENPTKWHSLHEKQDTYTWYDESQTPDTINNIAPDEGFIQLGVAEDPDDKDAIFVSETLARWEGWSLSVHKPGFAINEADDYTLKDGETQTKDFVNKDKKDEAKKYVFNPDLEFKVNASSSIVPGSLPKLRFGKDYHIRIRSVDLAGNSVDLDFQSESPTLTHRKNIRYMRYEPLASPIVLAGNELKDGEFLEHMVIRSNYDQTATEYEDTHEVDGKFFDEYSQRFLLPPKNSQLMAETHGMFEKAFTNNPAEAQKIYEIITGHEGLYQQKEKNKERIYKPSEVEIIYLPDPMAAGVSLFVAEGYQNTHSQDFKARMFSFFTNTELAPDQTNIDIPEDWYNAAPIRIRLEEGETHTKWDAQKRIFTVFLPKGYRTRIKFSTFWREKDLTQLSALWQLVKSDAPGNIRALKQLAKSGQHWMVSPSRELELVHAVQQPVDKPEIMAIYPDREYNSTTVAINTRFDIHGESTEKVAFQARWVDPIDDGISVSIKEKEESNSISNITVHYHDDKVTKGSIPEKTAVVNPNHKFVVIKPELQFKKRTAVDFKANPQPGAKKVNQLYKPQLSLYNKYKKGKAIKQIAMVDRLKLDLMEPKLSFVKDMNLRILPLEQQFNDTKHRWVDYRLVGSSRYREYFDKLLAVNPDLKTTRESDWVKKVNILSSSRPQPPEIDYVIPTFEWKKSEQGDQMVHQRLGGGLRIFIKRPWYSSGIDEKLAVILPGKNSNYGVAAMSVNGGSGYNKAYTNWGIDPILLAQKPEQTGPKAEDFRFSPEIDRKVKYPNLKNTFATAVAYPVHFDEDRQLWYCDIALNTKQMYFPFIKLVVARYQKHAVRKDQTDVCLSPTVTTDMVQLVPERKTSIHFKNGQKSTFKMTVNGGVFNERYAQYGNYNYLKISFLDAQTAQPIAGIIQIQNKRTVLAKSNVKMDINARFIQNNRYTISKEFALPKQYNSQPYKILVEEYERGPVKMDLANTYKSRLQQTPDTDRLIYADVFAVNNK